MQEKVDEIHARRLAAGDDDLHLWSDTTADVIVYAVRNRRVHRHIRVADARAALLLIRDQRAQLDALELEALEACREDPEHRVPWSALAGDMGLSSPQAADQRRDRLRVAVAARIRHAATDPADAERAWTLQNGARIRSAAAALVRASVDIAAVGDAEVLDVMEDLDSCLDGYRASHLQHAALLHYFGALAAALGEHVATIPAVRTAAELRTEYLAATT
ncbi:hypothetical protein [Actinomadura sp. CNU-125]|uniref:hypothetical protein n=1 Tax=Actinomadura sp. CNU-125 TaxID=1904961 RepID=UPI001177A752|nr:hypothetical protein [Actinomadura sp. CNU-125]